MAKGVRAIVAAAALGVGLLGVAGAARAYDTYSFSYISTFVRSGMPFTASGTFEVLSGSTIVTSGTATYGLNTYSIRPSATGMLRSGFQEIDFFLGNRIYEGSIFSFVAPVNGVYSSTTATGRVNGDTPADRTSGFSTGIFEAMLSPASGSGSSTSGNAPSPEVNTLLGFLVVGGTVAFLKRRRKGSGAEGMAAA